MGQQGLIWGFRQYDQLLSSDGPVDPFIAVAIFGPCYATALHISNVSGWERVDCPLKPWHMREAVCVWQLE